MTAWAQNHVGELAGLATSLLWTGTSLLFTAAARRLGPTLVNGTRIWIAIVLLGATHRLLTGQWIPDLRPRQAALLAASGLVGLTLGDQALFTAFVDVGPRLAMLVMTTAPLLAALFGWGALGETLGSTAWLGVGLTLGGVTWVILERPQGGGLPHLRPRLRGLVCALVAAACQAGGLLLSKQGMGHGWLPETEHLSPQTATFVRMGFAGLGVLPILLWWRLRPRRAGHPPPASGGSRLGGLAFTLGGATVGPFLGVWMSLVASDHAPLGVAQTLCGLSPVFILPFAAVIHKERVSPRAVLGAVVAVGGSAVLFFGR